MQHMMNSPNSPKLQENIKQHSPLIIRILLDTLAFRHSVKPTSLVYLPHYHLHHPNGVDLKHSRIKKSKVHKANNLSTF